MGLFGRDRLPPVEERVMTFQQIWGAGLDVADVRGNTMQRAVSLVPVFACTRAIADTVASMPLEAYRLTGEERLPIDLPQLFQDPSIFGGTFEWVQRALMSMLLRGEAFGIITEFTYDGWPRQIEWLNPDQFVVMNDDMTMSLILYGRADWRWYGRPIMEWTARGQGIPGHLVHVPWYVLPGFIRGLSPIAAFKTTFEGGLHAQKYGKEWFRSGGRPSGVLQSEQPINQAQAEEVKGRFKTATAGADVAVLGAGLKYQPVSVPPEEAQFLQTIRATASQIASIYGLPPTRVGGESAHHTRTYANVEQEAQDFINALLPYMTKLEQYLSGLMPRGQFVKFNVDAMIRADMKARFEAYQTALGGQMGSGRPFMTVDEVRRIENMEPMDLDQLNVQPQAGDNVLPLPPQPTVEGDAADAN